jgi:hypothetical protein
MQALAAMAGACRELSSPCKGSMRISSVPQAMQIADGVIRIPADNIARRQE